MSDHLLNAALAVSGGRHCAELLDHGTRAAKKNVEFRLYGRVGEGKLWAQQHYYCFYVERLDMADTINIHRRWGMSCDYTRYQMHTRTMNRRSSSDCKMSSSERLSAGKTTSLSVSHFGTANNVSADDDDDDGDDVAAPLLAHEANITEKNTKK